MNKQRKVLITVTYNEMGIIIDTKAEELDSSAQPETHEKHTETHACDLISRQDVLDALHYWFASPGFTEDRWWNSTHVLAAIEGVPSAQPEIIRCKDCKHYKEWESEFTPNAVVTQCMADNFPIRKAIPDGWFCAGAERRTDE